MPALSVFPNAISFAPHIIRGKAVTHKDRSVRCLFRNATRHIFSIARMDKTGVRTHWTSECASGWLKSKRRAQWS